MLASLTSSSAGPRAMMQHVLGMTAAIVVTVLTALFVLITVLTCLATDGYTARPPTAPDAMSLATPLLGGVAAWLLLLIAAWVVLASGGFAWLPGPAAVRGGIATLAVIGIFIVAAKSFFDWGDHGLRGVVPTVGTTLVPLLLAGVLVWCAWNPPLQWPAVLILRSLAVPLGVTAVIGVYFGVMAAVGYVAQQERVAVANTRREADQVADIQRWNALSPLEQTKEMLSKFAPDGDIALPCTLLRSPGTPEIEQAVLNHARSRPDFEGATADALASPHSEYRHAMLRVVALDGRRPEAWRTGIHKAIALATSDVTERGCYETYAREAAAAVAAARGWPAWEFADDFGKLRDAAEVSSVADGREAMLRVLHDVAPPRH